MPGLELAWFWNDRERWQRRALFGKAPCLSQGLAVQVLAVLWDTVKGAGAVGRGERAALVSPSHQGPLPAPEVQEAAPGQPAASEPLLSL